jgi:cell wall-associated NlpC family hydrolase
VTIVRLEERIDIAIYMRRVRHFWFIPVVVLCGILAVGCSSTKPSATGWGGKLADIAASDAKPLPPTDSFSESHEQNPVKESTSGNAAFEAGVHTQLLDILSTELHTWLGTPHVWGGTGKKGVDCSGLIQTVYASTLGVHVPRTTAEMKKHGDKVQRSDLKTGDLVFFRPDGDGRHVGIYMSNNEFVHASSSRGVMRSHLTDTYWDRYYDTARRVLSNDAMMQSAVSYGRATHEMRSDFLNN